MVKVRRSKRLAEKLEANQVIAIDNSGEEKHVLSDDDRQTEKGDEIDVLRLRIATTSLEDKDLPQGPTVHPLSDEEEAELMEVWRQNDEKGIKYIPSANITLRGRDFRRLRAARWLNDEIINAYMSLINERNASIFHTYTEDERRHIPRTHAFNTFFYTRLTSGQEGYDYAGVQKWTGVGKVDVMKQDLLLFPVNLGNDHWILAGIERPRRVFCYFNTTRGSDRSGVLASLRRYYYDELKDKYGEDIANQEDLQTWSSTQNEHMIREADELQTNLEASDCRPCLAKIPVQLDGSSCGVFVSKIADCLSIGIKICFKQSDILLLRRRMALELLRGKLEN